MLRCLLSGSYNDDSVRVVFLFCFSTIFVCAFYIAADHVTQRHCDISHWSRLVLVWEAAVVVSFGSPVGACGVSCRPAASKRSLLPAAVGVQLSLAFVGKGCTAPSHSLSQPADDYSTRVRLC